MPCVNALTFQLVNLKFRAKNSATTPNLATFVLLFFVLLIFFELFLKIGEREKVIKSDKRFNNRCKRKVSCQKNFYIGPA